MNRVVARPESKIGDELGPRDLARLSRRDRFREQGIVIERDLRSLRHAAVDADRRRLAISDDESGVGSKILISALGRDPRFDRVTALADFIL